ncbi:hypothetical protein DFH04_10765 [Clostridium novyi]|uniref:restriction endonuclease n=1 Tax=Clostridium novyi TaxID=1542 RepID=UPI000EA3BE54|nr:restriction endonuclease [Clostridium novyi]AYF55180.1 hypothetical protein DFH04_10765 [Clostridium novyi]
MDRISTRDLKAICKYISENYKYEEMEFDNYLKDYAFKIKNDVTINISEETIIDTLSDIQSNYYKRLVELICKTIEKNGPISKINLKYSPPIHLISNTKFGENVVNGDVDRYKLQLNYILNNDNYSGVFYEKFCYLFLEDIGILGVETKHSGDAGIDIIATTDIYSNKQLANHLFVNKMLMLVQVKFYKNKADSSIIRHIIGDGMLYRFENEKILFNPMQLIVVNHSGFNPSAEMYAKKMVLSY